MPDRIFKWFVTLALPGALVLVTSFFALVLTDMKIFKVFMGVGMGSLLLGLTIVVASLVASVWEKP